MASFRRRMRLSSYAVMALLLGGATGGPLTVNFGLLTLALAGGIAAPAGAASFGGTATGLELVGGNLRRAASGILAAGTVIWNTGQTWTIACPANTFTVSDDAQLKAAAEAAQRGQFVELRSGYVATSKVAILPVGARTGTGYVTIRSDPLGLRARPRAIGIDGASGGGDFYKITQLDFLTDVSHAVGSVVSSSGTVNDMQVVDNTITVTGAETITGGTGDDDITLGAGIAAGSITLSSGTDTLRLANATNTLTIGGDIDTLVGNSGADTITLSATVTGRTYDLGAGSDKLVLANGTNTVTVSSVETVTGNSGNDSVTLLAGTTGDRKSVV